MMKFESSSWWAAPRGTRIGVPVKIVEEPEPVTFPKIPIPIPTFPPRIPVPVRRKGKILTPEAGYR